MSAGVFKILQYLTAFLLRKLKIKFLLASVKSLSGENQPINQIRILMRLSEQSLELVSVFKEASKNFTIIFLFLKATLKI